MSPVSCIALIFFFSASVNDTPTRVNADMPLIGSFNALPSNTDADSTEPNPAADRSWLAFDARSNVPPSCPADFAISENVLRVACPCLIEFWSMPVFRACASACLISACDTASALSPNKPIDFVICVIFAFDVPAASPAVTNDLPNWMPAPTAAIPRNPFIAPDMPPSRPVFFFAVAPTPFNSALAFAAFARMAILIVDP